MRNLCKRGQNLYFSVKQKSLCCNFANGVVQHLKNASDIKYPQFQKLGHYDVIMGHIWVKRHIQYFRIKESSWTVNLHVG